MLYLEWSQTCAARTCSSGDLDTRGIPREYGSIRTSPPIPGIAAFRAHNESQGTQVVARDSYYLLITPEPRMFLFPELRKAGVHYPAAFFERDIDADITVLVKPAEVTLRPTGRGREAELAHFQRNLEAGLADCLRVVAKGALREL